MEKKNLILSIPSLWAFRNFVHSGIIEHLKNIFNVIVLIPQDFDILEHLKTGGIKIIKYDIHSSTIVSSSLLNSMKLKLLRKHETLKKSKLTQLHFTNRKNRHRKLLYILELLFSYLPEEILLAMYKKTIKCNFDNDISIAELKSSIVIATNFVVKHEMDLFLSIHKYLGKSINFVNSFDNTTSRGYIPYKIFKHHIVWNKHMKNELHRYFQVERNAISVMGTPQFDMLKQYSQLPLDNKDRLHNIVENKSYILYCAGHCSLLPFEVNLVESIISKLYDKVNLDILLVIRIHPLDNYSRWEILDKKYSKAIIDYPWEQNKGNALKSMPGIYAYKRHGRILKNAKLILNIGSTTTLDACIVDTPVFNLYFEDYNKNGELDLIYNSEHFLPIVKSGAAPFIYTLDELVNVACNLESYNSLDLSEKRKSFSYYYCGFNPNKTFIKRFSSYLLEL